MKRIYITALLLCVSCVPICDKVDHEEEHANDRLTQDKRLIVMNNHSLIQHHLCVIRNKNTKSGEFKEHVKQITALLCYEAAKDLPTVKNVVRTPIEKTTCMCLDGRIFVIPILRAGLCMSTVAEEIFRNAVTYHLGMYRDEETRTPVWYYNKLKPKYSNPSKIRAIVLDPMLATGGSAYEAIKECISRGIKEENIIFICIIGAPDGVKKLRNAFPKIKILAASIDRKLNEKSYIVPGLGDAGDRIFGTDFTE